MDGGPPHRETPLIAPLDAEPAAPGYADVAAEISRGIFETSGLIAEAAEPGWLGARCESAAMADWLAEAINQENVQARRSGPMLYLPCGQHFRLDGEIKNVVTAVAKTTHYWREHLPESTKQALMWQCRLSAAANAIARIWRRSPARTG